MAMYFVTHPNIGFSATVEAPATEKARTTYLDYLERNGRVLRRDRQYYRRNMIAKRISSADEVPADIHLDYDYEHDSSEFYPAAVSPVRFKEESRYTEPSNESEQVIEAEEPLDEGPASTLSPIERLSLGG